MVRGRKGRGKDSENQIKERERWRKGEGTPEILCEIQELIVLDDLFISYQATSLDDGPLYKL